MYRALKTGVNVLKASDSDNLEVQKKSLQNGLRIICFQRKQKMYCALYNEHSPFGGMQFY